MEKTAVPHPPYDFTESSSHMDLCGHLINVDNLEILKIKVWGGEGQGMKNRNDLRMYSFGFFMWASN